MKKKSFFNLNKDKLISKKELLNLKGGAEEKGWTSYWCKNGEENLGCIDLYFCDATLGLMYCSQEFPGTITTVFSCNHQLDNCRGI